MGTVFLTGYPGFLGSALVERLLERLDDETTITCLIQAAYREEAESRLDDVGGRVDADATARVELVEGDITQPDLALGDQYDDLADATESVYHLAAVYDLTMDRDVGEAVNVDGTRHVVDFAVEADADRLHYVSTVVVAGDFEGTFTEEMLQEGQSFQNHYESSKHVAEVLVRERMDEVPTTIYRPGVAVGDSETGETQKYDGPYAFLDALTAQPPIAVVPVPYGASTSEFNVVPSDYVIDAIDYLSGIDESVGKTYNLADPNPPTTTEMVDILAQTTDKLLTFTPPYPKGLVGGFLRSLTPLLGREPDFLKSGVMEYQTWDASFDCSNALEDLEGSGIRCPHFSEYAQALTDFYREHPEIGSEGMH